MEFLLIIVEPRGDRESRSGEEGRALYDEMVRFGEGLAAQGQLLASRSLRPDKHGTIKWVFIRPILVSLHSVQHPAA